MLPLDVAAVLTVTSAIVVSAQPRDATDIAVQCTATVQRLENGASSRTFVSALGGLRPWRIMPPEFRAEYGLFKLILEKEQNEQNSQKSAEEGADTLQNQLRSAERAAGAYLRLHCVHKHVRIRHNTSRIPAECEQNVEQETLLSENYPPGPKFCSHK